jgi:ribonuclease P protein component
MKYRLKKRKQFNYIHRNGIKLNGEFIVVVFCGNGGKSANPKIGFSASKKVGNSVVRHRAVRLMREALKPFLSIMKVNNNYIFIAKEGITNQHLLYITLDVQKLLERIK